MARIGVVGLGPVGTAVLRGMPLFRECSRYDMVGNYELNDVLDTDTNFICVSTPESRDGRLDCSKIYGVKILLDFIGVPPFYKVPRM